MFGTVLISLISLASIIFSDQWMYLPRILIYVCAVNLAIWVFFYEPKIRFDNRNIEIRNPLRIFRANWSAITDFETRYGFTVVAGSKRFVSWSAPAPSRRVAGRLTRNDFKGTRMQGEEFVEPGTVGASESGYVLTKTYEIWKEAKREAPDFSVKMNWLGVTGISLIALLLYLSAQL